MGSDGDFSFLDDENQCVFGYYAPFTQKNKVEKQLIIYKPRSKAYFCKKNAEVAKELEAKDI